MSKLAAFFKQEENTATGVFYPTNYIVAMYPSLAEASLAEKEVNMASPSAVAASGAEMMEFMKDHEEKNNLWGAMMREVSTLIGTEEKYKNQDMEQAEHGAAFVAAYCADYDAKAKVWAVLQKHNPLVARFYGSGGIEHLMREREG